MLDWDAKDTWWYVDQENKMMLNQEYPGCGLNGVHDSIEQAWHAYYAYDDLRFLEGIKSCWKKVYRTNKITKFLFGDYYYQGQRYPTPYPTMYGMSRDHLIYTICAMKHSGMSEEDLYEFISHIRFMISPHWGMQMTPALWLWMRLISGKKVGYLFYPWMTVEMSLNVLWNKFFESITGLNEERHQDEFIKINDPNRKNRPKVLNFFVGLLYPNYATKLVANQLNQTPNNKWNNFLKRITLKIVPKHNYLLKLLLDDPKGPTYDIVNSYKPMSGDRWSDILDPWMSDRWLTIVEDKYLHANTLDRDYLLKVYENKKIN